MAVEELDPKKYHRIDLMIKNHKNLSVLAGLVLMIVVLPLIGLAYYKTAVYRPSQTEKEITYEIKNGVGVSAVAGQLYEKGAINSEFLFKFYVVLNGLQEKIQAGVYTIPAGSNIVEIAGMLQHGTNEHSITFLEGWRVEEFARHASASFEKIDYENFIKEARKREGQLFPDTYRFNNDITESEMVDMLVNNFKFKTESILTKENLENAGLTSDEAVIFASILEREIHNNEDRPIVAGILIKRWREGQLLGADATTQYATAALRYGCEPNSTEICPNEEETPNVEWWPDNLTQAELQSDSPYNTRAVLGLPPTPIANPGANALNAVVNYEDSEYYYYLTDSEGETRFAKTLEEHNRNIANYL